MNINQSWLRVMGLTGILGGLLLFTGDMLFYYDSVSTNLKLNMGNASEFRIIANGILALLATWFYLFGLGQVYYAFMPSTKTVRNIVVVSFACILISYGIIHSAYIAIATTAKLAVQNHLDMETATALASNTNNILRLLVYPIFALLSFVFIWQVWKKKTLYPRWIILFFPLVPFLFQGLVKKVLSGSIWIVIVGGYLNLIIVVFFLASTIALWNTNTER
ncbi:MAG: hypothetical protein DRJ07_07430 [Bacteroidetes bacterium]|nr:MAG: hypothetical protein DRJ07_07430 [Bacteroidota bacterium]